MPESTRHGFLCELLYQILRGALGREHSIGKDNFVYFDAIHPRRCVAPDGFVKLGFARDVFDSWKTWERGAPELCVEILSPSDTKEKLSFPEKLRRYRALGTRELIAFDLDAPAGARVRAWDRIEDDLVERVVEGETTPCLALGLHWILAPGGEDLRSRYASRRPRMDGSCCSRARKPRTLLASRQRSRASTRKSHAVMQRPHASTQKPDALMRRPHAVMQKPRASTRKPWPRTRSSRSNVSRRCSQTATASRDGDVSATLLANVGHDRRLRRRAPEGTLERERVDRPARYV